MTDRERYPKAPKRRPSAADEDYWLEAACAVLLNVLDEQYAVTSTELEARASDRVWRPEICPYPINPHHFVNARRHLQGIGTIEPTAAPTTSHPDPILTWSRPATYGLGRKIRSAASRKRLLTARHNGWASRGGAGIGLIGRAGEEALDAALRHPESVLTGVTGSTRDILGIDPGEVDNSAYFIDTSDKGTPKLVVVMFEVKNTRQWYYTDSAESATADVGRFLSKAAQVQAERPDQAILPVFVGRKIHPKLWEVGEEHGFLPTWVDQQLVLPDYELTQEVLDEVRHDLGYDDLFLGSEPRHRHLGLVKKAIPTRASAYAERWKKHHRRYLSGTFDF